MATLSHVLALSASKRARAEAARPGVACAGRGRSARNKRADAVAARVVSPRPGCAAARLHDQVFGMEPRDGFLFEPLSIGTDGLEELASFFDNLPEDPYMPPHARYRLRRLSNLRGEGPSLTAEATTICQGATVNPLFPNVTRTFAPLEPAMVAHPAFRRILAAFRAAAGFHPDAPGGIDAHAIRTLAVPGGAGEPAPEGIHRDGRRVLGIFVISRRGIEGGATELHASRAGDAQPLFREVLQPGQGVLLNDREGGVFHFTVKVQAAAPDAVGTRDVIVMLC